MTERVRLPEFRRETLRNVATPERVERVWARLEDDLRSQGTRAVTRHWPMWSVLAPAAAVLLFAGGAVVGARYANPSTPPPILVSHEPSGLTERGVVAQPTAAPSVDDPRTAERPTGRGRKGTRARPRVAPPIPPPVSLEVPEPGPTAAPPAAPPEWYELWREDEYQRAREAIERQGGFDAMLEGVSADQAMAMVDIARFSHENALAIAALRRVVEKFPTDPNAPLAALTLGNLLDRAGDAKGAAAAFSAYRSLSPDGDFAEDALARQVEGALGEGDVSRARDLLAQYEKQYPAGSRLELLRADLAAAAAVEADGDAPRADPEPVEVAPAPSHGEGTPRGEAPGTGVAPSASANPAP